MFTNLVLFQLSNSKDIFHLLKLSREILNIQLHYETNSSVSLTVRLGNQCEGQSIWISI